MYGYVIPCRDELKVGDFERYKAAYCGLCRCLKKRFGFVARFTVSYDMTFLYCLLAAFSEKTQSERCFCPAHPFCRRACLPADAAMTYTADVSMLLTYWKLRDSVQDAGFFAGLPARAAARLLRRRYRRAATRLPELDERIRTRLCRLATLEAEQSASLDQTADAFAAILSGCADFITDAPMRRAAAQLLYHVGRVVYFADALDDLPQDVKKNRYNPLRYRFCLEDGALREADRQYFLQTADASVGMAASALELLELKSNQALLRNMIYLGLPTMLKAVSRGVYRRQRKI